MYKSAVSEWQAAVFAAQTVVPRWPYGKLLGEPVGWSWSCLSRCVPGKGLQPKAAPKQITVPCGAALAFCASDLSCKEHRQVRL